MSGDVTGLLAANERFYEAFEARDMDAMSDVWEHTDRVVCTHPGWATLRGWGPVAASWYSLFSGSQRLQFIVTNTQAAVAGDVGWVTCDENILDAAAGAAGATVAALNVFARSGDTWKLVVHHGSPVMA